MSVRYRRKRTHRPASVAKLGVPGVTIPRDTRPVPGVRLSAITYCGRQWPEPIYRVVTAWSAVTCRRCRARQRLDQEAAGRRAARERREREREHERRQREREREREQERAA